MGFTILDKDVSELLGITLRSLRRRLNNEFSKNIIYVENFDYIKKKNDKINGINYVLNFACLERLAMSGDTEEAEEAEEVRTYFIKLREFLTDNRHLISQSLFQYKELQEVEDEEVIYFFVADKNLPEILKYGRTKTIINRLRNYNTGRVNGVELKYLAVVKNSKLIEECIKLNTVKNRVYNNHELLCTWKYASV